MRNTEATIQPLSKVNEGQNNKTQSSAEVQLDWKNVLQHGLAKSQQAVQADKAWASFISQIREKCPETNWLTISEEFHASHTHLLRPFQSWVDSLIASPDWPFPDQVLIIALGRKIPSWLVVMSHQPSRLPLFNSPEGLLITPWKDKYVSGWKITEEKNYNLNKSGEA